MQFTEGETVEADEADIKDALADLLTAVDVIAADYGEGAALLAVVNLYRIYDNTFGLQIETDKQSLN